VDNAGAHIPSPIGISSLGSGTLKAQEEREDVSVNVGLHGNQMQGRKASLVREVFSLRVRQLLETSEAMISRGRLSARANAAIAVRTGDGRMRTTCGPRWPGVQV